MSSCPIARELIRHYRLGGQVKSYLPENPENFEEDDAMYHPKVGAKSSGDGSKR